MALSRRVLCAQIDPLCGADGGSRRRKIRTQVADEPSLRLSLLVSREAPKSRSWRDVDFEYLKFLALVA